MVHHESASSTRATPLDRRRLSTVEHHSPPPPPSPTYYPQHEPQPPVLPKRSQRVLALILKPIVLPALAIALPAWPLLAAACAIPVIGVMAIPILLLISVLLLYAVAWICYLFLAQKDLPATWTNARRWSPRNFFPFVPINPIRCAKVDLAAFRYTLTAFRLIFPAIFDWSYRRIMVIGTTKGSRVVKEGILYGSPSRGKRLDVYLPVDAPISLHSNASGVGTDTASLPTATSNGVPVIVVIPSMLGPLTITSKRRLYLQLALRLRRMGYCVIVADITYYPESRIKSSVIDLRLVLRWTTKNCQRYGGDPSKIYVLGHGLSAHLIMLTISQEAVVLSREGHLDRAYERERHILRSRHESGSSHHHGRRLGEPDSQNEEEDEEWLKSGEVRTTRRKRVASNAHSDALDEGNDEPVRLIASSSSRADRRSSGEANPAGAGGSEGWVDETEDSSSTAIPGHVMGSVRRFTTTNTFNVTGIATSTSRKVEEAESILSSAAYRKAEDEVGNGLRRVEIYEPEVELPAIAGVILLSGISDVIKGFRSESERGLEHLSYLRRSTGPSHFNCLIHSPAHLLYAAKNIVDTRLLPPKFLLVHGGKDQVVPVEQSTLLKTLLVGIGVEQVRLRAYRNLGHAESIACLFLGMARSNTRYTRQISEDISNFIAQ
ncbi:uncharacterized protein UMAG_03789 [Mycosarcoma maydis]|uniref:Uncharacterized protein n=1 Tax=Mycosarcoma maydis TaxID=5270 RepID=A0A0D1DVB3_MYCMD|nr:uncharacterized protein UMAG_03789 [Ustilago maydis 521]KIS68209.1 hypothetical protein UMAG_03789 [Ustilago maydis 521]|eukprot:XP_011390234.1 hypothetical protein UMAG_03789 [Ustilago maydis 521]